MHFRKPLQASLSHARLAHYTTAGGDGVMRKGKKEELARSGAFPPPTEGLNPDDEVSGESMGDSRGAA